MEKTTQIIIAETTFVCTQEALDRLSTYLKQMELHFANEEGSRDIMRDIESRIAEKLLEQKKSLITITEIQTVIAEIGEVSELEDGTSEAEIADEKLPRRLYRDTSTAIIGGVASGIATYFNANPLFIRLLFIASIFFGGTGIVLYMLLWIIIPEARTSAQKLEMQGMQVTFESIRDIVQTRGGDSRKSFFRSIPFYIHAAIAKILQFTGKIFGVLIMVGSFFGIIALTIFASVILTNWNSPINDIPFREASSILLLLITICAGYIAILIPLIFVFIFGLRLLRTRAILSTTTGFGLAGIWALAIIVTGTAGFKIASDYYTFVQTDPTYAIHTETISLEPFTHVITESANVQISEGDTYQAIVEGRLKATDEVELMVEDGILTIRTKDITDNCIFCDEGSASINISVPSLDGVEVNRGRVTFIDYTDNDSLIVEVNDGLLYGDLEVQDLSLLNKSGRIQANITGQTLMLEGFDSSFDLKGTVETATHSLIETQLYAESLITQDATIDMIDSYANITVRGSLTESADDDSELIIEGQTNPSLDDENLE